MAFPLKTCSSVLLFSPETSVGSGANFLYNAKAEIDSSVLLLTKRGKTLFTPRMNERQARDIFKGRVVPVSSGQLIPLLKKNLPRGKIGLELENLSALRHINLAKKLGGKNRFVDVSVPLESMRAVKKQDEISKIKKAISISRSILGNLHLKSSMTELDVVKILARQCLEHDVTFAYPPIVASGNHSGHPHHVPVKKTLGHGTVLIDFGVKYKKYCADLTRCYFLGPAKEEKKKYEEAKNIFHLIIDQMPDCHTAGDVVRASDGIIKKSGWPQLIHAPGHGIGIDVHEAPHLYSKNKEHLRPNMVMAIEPGWYGAKFGVRYENEVLLGKNKARVL